MDTMFWIWMAAALIFLIIEVGIPGLIFMCFAVGAVVAALYAQFHPEDFVYQAGLFGVVATLLIPVTRRIARKISLPSPFLSNVDALVNQMGIVIKEIDPETGAGQVRLQGEVWIATAETRLPVGSKVLVESVSGNRVRVRRIATAASAGA